MIISRGWPSGSQSAWPEAPAQSPSWVCASSALGPTTGDASRGRVGRRSGSVPSLREQHQRAAGDLEVELGVLGAADDRGLALDVGCRGSSNRPSSNLSVRMRPTAASMSASSSSPRATASCAPSKNRGVVITMSLPARTAAAAACA